MVSCIWIFHEKNWSLLTRKTWSLLVIIWIVHKLLYLQLAWQKFLWVQASFWGVVPSFQVLSSSPSLFGVDSAFITLSASVVAVFNNAKSTFFFFVDFRFSFLKRIVLFIFVVAIEDEVFVVFAWLPLSLFAGSLSTCTDKCSCSSMIDSSSLMSTLPHSSSLSLGIAILVTVSARWFMWLFSHSTSQN